MKGLQKTLYITFICLSSIVVAYAQPQPQNPSDDPDAVPITGLEYLLIGGGVYGVSRLLNKRKHKNDEM
jgi:hypothetical protein